MSAREDAYARHQQQRWMRPDAHRWIRPDAARFLKPGTDPATVYPALERKYSPNQPRVPAGNPDGGQWTDGDGNGTPRIARPMGRVDLGDLSEIGNLGLFQIAPRESAIDGVQLAGDERGIQIDPGELVNQHIINEHVGKTDAELMVRIQQTQTRGLFVRSGMERNGSFDSVESARDLISRTMEDNSEVTKQVASGQQRGAFLTRRFGYRTGKEAYLDLETFQIGMRATYEVGVAIAHDAGRNTGYRVLTAYPRNYNPRIGR